IDPTTGKNLLDVALGGGGGGGGLPGTNTASWIGGSTDLKARAHQAYLAAGMPLSEWTDFEQLIQHESGWQPTVKNPGSTAYGLGQFLDSTWASVGGQKTNDPMQ